MTTAFCGASATTALAATASSTERIESFMAVSEIGVNRWRFGYDDKNVTIT